MEDFIKELFERMNSENYVILRNFENYPEHIKNNIHEDIDVLCENRKKFIKAIGASPLGKRDDKVHYKVECDGENILIDIREIGDGYYCENWEKNMLGSRIKHKDLFFVLSIEEYFYSLSYHALIHKKNISEEYFAKLKDLRKKANGGDIESVEDIRNVLLNYLQENNYKITNCRDVNLKLYFSDVPQSFVDIKLVWEIKKVLYNTAAFFIRLIKSIGCLLVCFYLVR